MLSPDAKPLHPSYRKILIVIAWIVPVVQIGLMTPLLIFAEALPLWVRFSIVGSIAILITLVLQWYVRKWFKQYHYWLQTEGLFISKGVFWHSLTLIPKNRVQHIDITSGPLDRRYDLAKLVVNTAGTRNASVSLPGLIQAEAVALRRQLLDLADDDIV